MLLIFGITARNSPTSSCGDGGNLGADTRVPKEALLVQIKALDAMDDSSGLSADDWLRRYALEASPMEIFKGEELFWQR